MTEVHWNFLFMLLTVYGPMAVGLWWFASRAEGKLEGIGTKIDTLSHRISGMTKAMLMDVISRENASVALKSAAQDMLERIVENGGKRT